MMSYFINHEIAMLEAGAALAKAADNAAFTLFLQGDLGAGKTTFVRGFLQALGHNGKVKSPTFSLIEPYSFAAITVYHFDLYRIENPEELNNIGWRDYFSGENMCLIEWPEKAGHYMPVPDINLQIAIDSTSRQLQFIANSELGQRIMERFSLPPLVIPAKAGI